MGHHWLLPINCHFPGCKALLDTSLTHVSCAVASVQSPDLYFYLWDVIVVQINCWLLLLLTETKGGFDGRRRMPAKICFSNVSAIWQSYRTIVQHDIKRLQVFWMQTGASCKQVIWGAPPSLPLTLPFPFFPFPLLPLPFLFPSLPLCLPFYPLLSSFP